MQVITFTIRDKYYGINTNIVEEIITSTNLTNVPKSPDWIEGLINLRGDLVTLVNLSKLLLQEDGLCYNNIIIINHEEKIGLMIQDVEEVIEIEEKDIENLNGKDTTEIQGIIRINDNIINIIHTSILIQKMRDEFETSFVATGN